MGGSSRRAPASNFKMIQPQFELLPDASDDAETRLLEVGRITPVYESLGGARLASRWQRKTIFHLLEGLQGAVPECLPLAMLERLELPGPRDGAARGAFSARRERILPSCKARRRRLTGG
jgi:hypothetical protein